MKRWLVMAFVVLVVTLARESMAGVCQGRLANPITDICWNYPFPLALDGTPVMTMGQEDTGSPGGFLCTCTSPLRIDIKTGFWEPARRVGVTRTPYRFIPLGGIKFGPGIRAPEGEIRLQRNNTKQSNYQVHWYADPALYQLGVILDNPCLEMGSFDAAYITKIDPTWNGDELTMLLNPETFLFDNPIVQAACADDCMLSSAGFGGNALFWYAGRQDSVYPFSGHVQAHVSHVQASSLPVQRMTTRLHREFLMWGTSGADGLYGIYSKPMTDKTQYKYQMFHPIPQTEKINGRCCQPYGRTTAVWGAGKSYSYTGEGFTYIIFRERNYCLGVGF